MDQISHSFENGESGARKHAKRRVKRAQWEVDACDYI
jgi:hypothetical protein